MEKKVLIVDDSALFTETLTRIVSAVDGFAVCANACDVYSAADRIQKYRPDLIILDVQAQGMDGIRFLRRLIPQYAVPVIVCTARRSAAQSAFAAGAADFIAKPADFAKDFEHFCRLLSKSMQNVMNLRSVTCEGRIYELKKTSLTEPRGELILIGGSAGSTEALPIILSGFEKDMPPAAVTLHMPYGYTEIYARRLNEAVPIDVVEAENGMRLRNGMAAIAQGAKHLRVMKDGLGYYLSVSEGERVSGHCPSVDVLFESAAALKAKEMIAVILTGMGSDGAKGLLQLRRAGAYTIGQDEKSSLVYGMPKSAFEMGAVEKQCGLNKISQEIKRRLKEMIK